MAYQLYQVAVLELPKKCNKKDEEDEFRAMPKIIIDPITIVARDEKSAALKVAVLKAKELGTIDPDRVEVMVRPF